MTVCVLPSDVEIMAAVRRWLNQETAWQEKLAAIQELSPRDLFHSHRTLAKELAFPSYRSLPHGASIVDLAEARSILEHAGYFGFADKTDLLRRVLDTLLDEVQTRIDVLFQQTFYPELSAHSAQAPASPMFSAGTELFLDEKEYEAQARRQNSVTFRLWVELIGDKPCRSYTGEHAANFKSLLLALPSSHCKGGHTHAQEEIQRAHKRDLPRLSLKTAKRHFSALSQYWVWLKLRGAVDTNIFLGFSFPGTKSSKSKRDAWAADDLEILFGAQDWKGAHQDSAWHWLPLLSLYSGLRLEEACRLRPEDVEQLLGVWCLRIRGHPDGWSPKTEAGERDVPVHSWLINHGFIKLVEKRRQEGTIRIFSDLTPGGPDGRLGFAFSRSWSKMLRRLDISPKITFHSFRHTFRTSLEETDHLDRHLAAIGGWEREARDEGSRTYAKRIARLIPKLHEVVEDFRPPLEPPQILGP